MICEGLLKWDSQLKIMPPWYNVSDMHFSILSSCSSSTWYCLIVNIVIYITMSCWRSAWLGWFSVAWWWLVEKYRLMRDPVMPPFHLFPDAYLNTVCHTPNEGTEAYSQHSTTESLLSCLDASFLLKRLDAFTVDYACLSWFPLALFLCCIWEEILQY